MKAKIGQRWDCGKDDFDFLYRENGWYRVRLI